MTTLQSLQELLDARFHGKLSYGKHEENGECCALELLSAYHALPWTDDPTSVRCFDLRSLNDIRVSDELRTTHLLPVLVAYDGSLDWPYKRQVEVAKRIIIGIVRDVISQLPILPEATRNQCLGVRTLADASAAASAAADCADRAAAAAVAVAAAARAAADAAADAARAAADAARAAADAAAYAALAAADAAAAARAAYAARAANADCEAVFTTSCRVFLEAASQKEQSDGNSSA